MFLVSDLKRDFKFVSGSLLAACRTLAAGPLLPTAVTGGGKDLVENLRHKAYSGMMPPGLVQRWEEVRKTRADKAPEGWPWPELTPVLLGSSRWSARPPVSVVLLQGFV